MRFFIVTLLLWGAVALAFPQGGAEGEEEEVSGDDVLRSAQSSGSYNNNKGAINQDLINELFGTNATPKPNNINNNNDYKPPKVVVDDKSSLCADYANDGYQCVPYYQCDDLGEIITDGGPGLIDVRGNFGQDISLDPENSKCEGYLEVCCRHPDYTAPVKPKPKPYISKCGTRNVNGIGVRIANNPIEASTQFGEWPHMCAVLEKSGDKNLYVCGGSLIAPNVVMTAAHCVEKYTAQGSNHLVVRCGEWDTQKKVEPLEHQDREVEVIAVHPGFSRTNLTNNVALLHTYEPFALAAHIDVICLPNLEELQNSYAWEGCVATGWGKDKFDKTGQYQVILKQVDLNLVAPYQCQEALRSTRLGYNFNLDPTALCAGGGANVDTCKGDGGGPLVCPTGKSNGYGLQYVQAGIVGWGIGCGKDGVPGVYTDVADMLCFIDWSTRCVNADASYDAYGINGCQKWAQRERRRLIRARDDYQYQASLLPAGRPQARILRRVKQHEDALEKFSLAIKQCRNDAMRDDSYDDSEDFSDYDATVDLNGYTRTGASLERKAAELQKDGVNSEDQ